MIKIVKHTGQYETLTRDVEQEDGTTISEEYEAEIIEDTKHTDIQDEKRRQASILAASWNQEETEEGVWYAVASY